MPVWFGLTAALFVVFLIVGHGIAEATVKRRRAREGHRRGSGRRSVRGGESGHGRVNAAPERERRPSAPVDSFPYTKQEFFVSDYELEFYHKLAQMVAGRAVVLVKVKLDDLFGVTGADPGRMHWDRISRRHVDFLVCASKTLIPLFGVELNDGSHRSNDARERERFKDGVFAAADVRLLRCAGQDAVAMERFAAEVELLLCDVPNVVSRVDDRSEWSVGGVSS